MNFRKAIRKATNKVKLNFRDRIKLNIILLIPSYRRELEEKLLAKAIEYQIVPPTTMVDTERFDDIDWEQVIDFIITWLPTILRLIIVFL